jgi:hypothetical protein
VLDHATRANFSPFVRIPSRISGLSSNVAFGVGSYNDCRNGPGDCIAASLPLAYTQRQNLTTNTSAVQSALSGLFPSGGGDFPESNIYGLHQAANTTSWRTDSNRFLFWAGDAPGHDPRQGVTEADARDALVDNNVKTYALNVGSLNSTGQAARPERGECASATMSRIPMIGMRLIFLSAADLSGPVVEKLARR